VIWSFGSSNKQVCLYDWQNTLSGFAGILLGQPMRLDLSQFQANANQTMFLKNELGEIWDWVFAREIKPVFSDIAYVTAPPGRHPSVSLWSGGRSGLL